MTNTEKVQHVRNVISATSKSLCSWALHISVTYDNTNLMECVALMSDDEWVAWTDMPAEVKGAYMLVMSDGNGNTKDIVQIVFDNKINEQREKFDLNNLNHTIFDT